MKSIRVLCLVVAIAVGRVAFAQAPNAGPTAGAADSSVDARTRALASQLRCPVCQGLSIQDSPSELAQQMRDVVRTQIRDGRTPDEVKRYFVARYGQWILMEPPAAGFNWVVYALPLVALLGGGAVVAGAVHRWTTAPVPSVPSNSADASGASRSR